MEKIIRQFIQAYADSKGYKLSDKADIIIKGIIKKSGGCPCKLQSNLCPCEGHEKEIEEKGRCHCNLFIKE